jgi:hypothetical protein
MSALPPIADISWRRSDVCFVPIADIEFASLLSAYRPVEISMVRHFELDCGHAFHCTCAIIDSAVVG